MTLRNPARLAVALVFVCSLVLGMVGTAWTAEILVSGVPSQGDPNRPAAIRDNGDWLLLYQNPEQRVVFRRADSDPIVLDEDAEATGGQYFSLFHDDDRIYAIWWQKLPDATKRLYLRASWDGGESFGPLVRLNSGGGVLPRFELAADGTGRVAVAYYDERSPRFQIYLNRSLDGGESWLEEDLRLDGERLDMRTDPQQPLVERMRAQGAFAIEPKLRYVGTRLVALWKEVVPGEAQGAPVIRISTRVSDDGGENWGDVQVIHRREGKNLPTEESLAVLPDGTLVVSVFQPEEGLLGYMSSDGGQTWSEGALMPGSGAFEAFTQMQSVAAGDRMILIYSLDVRGKRPQVHAGVFDTETGQWTGETQWLARKNFDTTRSWNAAATALSDGEVVAVWEDYDAIRAGLRFNVSRDAGASWDVERPRFLSEPGRYTEGWPRVVHGDDGRVFVTFYRWRDDSRMARDFMGVELPLDEAGSLDLARLPAPQYLSDTDARRSRLQERAQAFWQARIQHRWEDTFDFFDPVYRKSTTLNSFMVGQGTVRYKSFDIKEVLVWDNIGGVIVDVTFDAPQVLMPGTTEPVSIPETLDTLRTEWVWMHDDWYLVHQTGMGSRALEY